MADQDTLNAYVGRISAAVAELGTEIQALKDSHPELDFSALDTVVASLEGLEAPAVEAPVADDSSE